MPTTCTPIPTRIPFNTSLEPSKESPSNAVLPQAPLWPAVTRLTPSLSLESLASPLSSQSDAPGEWRKPLGLTWTFSHVNNRNDACSPYIIHKKQLKKQNLGPKTTQPSGMIVKLVQLLSFTRKNQQQNSTDDVIQYTKQPTNQQQEKNIKHNQTHLVGGFNPFEKY